MRFVCSLKPSRHLIAALMLLAWVIMSGHVALEHGGAGRGMHVAAALHGGQHHDEEPAPAEDHHHELGAVTVTQFTKAAEKQLLAPTWQPLYDQLVAELAALLRSVDGGRPVLVDLQSDGRASGWLFVVQTALPVRGPSLAV